MKLQSQRANIISGCAVNRNDKPLEKIALPQALFMQLGIAAAADEQRGGSNTPAIFLDGSR
jgi:hypothetical protein